MNMKKEIIVIGSDIQYPKEFVAKYDPIYGFNGTISGDKFVLNGEYVF